MITDNVRIKNDMVTAKIINRVPHICIKYQYFIYGSFEWEAFQENDLDFNFFLFNGLNEVC